MISCERVRAALSGQVPDRIPKTFTFWEASLPDIAPLSPSDYFDLDVRFVDIKPPAGQEDFLRYLGSLPHDLHLGSLAELRSYYEWNYHPESVAGSSPLGQIQTAEDLERVILPDSIDPSRYADLSGQVEDWHARGLAVAASPAAPGRPTLRDGLSVARLRTLPDRPEASAARGAISSRSTDRLDGARRGHPGPCRCRYPVTRRRRGHAHRSHHQPRPVARGFQTTAGRCHPVGARGAPGLARLLSLRRQFLPAAP